MVFNKTTQKGFTLIELILYIAILGSLLTVTVGFLMLSVDARTKNQSISEVNQQGNFVMEYMAQTIRNASAITAPVPSASSSSLTITVPTPGLSPTIFDAPLGALQVKEGAALALPLTNDKIQITNLTFTNLSHSGTNGVVRISFTVSRTNQSGRNEYDYQKTFITSVSLRQ